MTSLRRRIAELPPAYVVALVLLGAQATRRSFQPMRHILTIVPDDAFYYLDLARAYAQTGTWSFDGGLTRTTGFHPFHGYACAFIFTLAPGIDARTLAVLWAWIGVVVTAIAIWLIVLVVERHLGRAATLGVLVVCTGANFLTQATNVMEWEWVVLSGALAVWAIAGGRAWVALATGVLGALSRSDFPLFAVAALVAAGFVAWRRGDRFLVRPAAALLAGAAIGFAILTLHNYAVTHELVQSSARVKVYWGKVVGYDLRTGFETAALAGAPGSLLLGKHSIRLVLALHAVAAVVAYGALRWRPPPPSESVDVSSMPLFLGLLGGIATTGYALLYATSKAAVMPWYTAELVVPLALVYAVAFRPLRWRKAFVPLLAVMLVFAALGFKHADDAELPLFASEMDAGDHLREHPVSGRVAGWNVGILNWYEGGHVVNLDGLTNDAVVPYITSDRLHCYLLANDIRHVLDWQPMVDCKRARCPRYPELGGYTSGVLVRSLTPEWTAPGTEQFANESLVMYRVDHELLAREGGCP